MNPSSAPPEQHPEGCMAVVVGPSGAGKDTLIAYAARHFQGRSDIVFARRVITREADAGGEDHEAVCEEDFARMDADGQLAVAWEAHGLHYGIPAETRAAVSRGVLVVANGSRSALDLFKQNYSNVVVIKVVARPEVLAARLEARGRESSSDILSRLERRSPEGDGGLRTITIDNSGSVEEAGMAMIDVLLSLIDEACGGREK
jgi:ribose 1,5-bisphosphokinase